MRARRHALTGAALPGKISEFRDMLGGEWKPKKTTAKDEDQLFSPITLLEPWDLPKRPSGAMKQVL